jgi:hypothetical protein
MRLKQVLIILFLAVPLVVAGANTSGYKITIIDGESAMNSVQGKGAREPVIQVEDKDRKPVAGAYVEFDTPGSGAGAAFANGSTHFATTTNADGMAVASGLANNGVAGAYIILVHVSYQGQSIGELDIHQTNISASLSKNMQQGAKNTSVAVSDTPNNVTISDSVLGIALGDQFIVNGSPTPSNANLLKGTRIQTLEKPVTLYMHDHCEYLVGPHSAVMISPKAVGLENGSVRAKKFGDCKIVYSGIWITGAANADGVAALSGQTLDVASVSGDVRVMNGAGDVISTVSPGTVSSFGPSSTTAASGASAGGGSASIPFKQAVILGTTVAVALASLGLATDAILQPTSGTPTSP